MNSELGWLTAMLEMCEAKASAEGAVAYSNIPMSRLEKYTAKGKEAAYKNISKYIRDRLMVVEYKCE